MICLSKAKKKSLLLKLIEVVLVKEIQKALKQSPPTYLPRNSVFFKRPFARLTLGRVRPKFVIPVANEAIILDPVGPIGVQTTLSTENESNLLLIKNILVAMDFLFFRLGFPFHLISLPTCLTVSRRVI